MDNAERVRQLGVGDWLKVKRSDGAHIAKALAKLTTPQTQGRCREIAARNLPLTWGCEMRVSDAKEDVLFAMKEAGCNFVGFGVESGNQEILNKTKKASRSNRCRVPV